MALGCGTLGAVRSDDGKPQVTAGERSRRFSNRAVPLELALITVVAAVAMLFELGEKPLAGDEATSYFIAWLPWEDFWRSLTTSEANASLFYALLRLPLLFGSDEWLLRLIAAISGVLTVPLLYAVLRRLFDRWVAGAGAAFLAVNAFFVAHAQDVRGYSMAAMFATLATLLFISCVANPTRLRLALYATAGVAACYSHFFSALVLAAHLLSLFALPAERVAWKRFAVAYGTIGAFSMPLAYFVLSNDRGQIDWILPTTGEIVVKNLYEFAGHGGRLPAVAAAIGVALAIVRTGRALRAHGRSEEAWSGALLLLWLFVAFAFTFAVTFIKPIFIARYLLPALPALAGAMAFGFGMLRWRPAFVAAGAIVVALLALQLPDWYSATKPDWRDRANRVVTNAQRGDATVLYAPTAIRPFGYYAGYYAERDDGGVAPPPIYPPVDWLGYSQTRFEPDLDMLLREAAAHERVWLVLGFAEDEARQEELAEVLAFLSGGCSRVRGFTGAVRLYEDCTYSEGAL